MTGVGFAGFGVDVLRSVSGIGVATITEGVTIHHVDSERAFFTIPPIVHGRVVMG
jgi:hypothetical protein